jgi:hypothetical protein
MTAAWRRSPARSPLTPDARSVWGDMKAVFRLGVSQCTDCALRTLHFRLRKNSILYKFTVKIFVPSISRCDNPDAAHQEDRVRPNHNLFRWCSVIAFFCRASADDAPTK